jgi:hypothetical protein
VMPVSQACSLAVRLRPWGTTCSWGFRARSLPVGRTEQTSVGSELNSGPDGAWRPSLSETLRSDEALYSALRSKGDHSPRGSSRHPRLTRQVEIVLEADPAFSAVTPSEQYSA